MHIRRVTKQGSKWIPAGLYNPESWTYFPASGMGHFNYQVACKGFNVEMADKDIVRVFAQGHDQYYQVKEL